MQNGLCGPSLPLVTNHRHIYREGKGGEGPQASESSSHLSRALLPVLLGRARFFGQATCHLVTRQAVGPSDICIPNSRGHTEAWESVSPTRGATPKRGGPHPQLEGPHGSVGVRIPNSRGHAKAWERETRKKERTQYRCSPLKEFGAALGPGVCSECRIFTSQQTTFV